MLHSLLQDALHLAVGIAHESCQTTHVYHVHLAAEQENGYEHHDDQCQNLVHGEQIDEGAYEHHKHRESVGDCFGEEVDDVVYVEFQAVEHVA